jgi:hypothetical protein
MPSAMAKRNDTPGKKPSGAALVQFAPCRERKSMNRIVRLTPAVQLGRCGVIDENVEPTVSVGRRF